MAKEKKPRKPKKPKNPQTQDDGGQPTNPPKDPPG